MGPYKGLWFGTSSFIVFLGPLEFRKTNKVIGREYATLDEVAMSCGKW
jgi:hypothetical protein